MRLNSTHPGYCDKKWKYAGEEEEEEDISGLMMMTTRVMMIILLTMMMILLTMMMMRRMIKKWMKKVLRLQTRQARPHGSCVGIFGGCKTQLLSWCSLYNDNVKNIKNIDNHC